MSCFTITSCSDRHNNNNNNTMAANLMVAVVPGKIPSNSYLLIA